MLNHNIWIGMDKRKRSLNPIFMFGAGMNIGEKLNPYIQDVLLSVLLEIYYREIRDDEARARADIFEIVREVMETFKLEFNEEVINRLGEGIFYYGDRKRMEAYKGHYYNNDKHKFEEQRFSYLEPDREYTKLKKGTIVYKLTDESIRMILMSREFEEEMDMTVEQLYTLQLIKAGRVIQALNVLDELTLKIRRLLLKEKDYRYELERNPRTLLINKETRKNSKEDVRKQSEEAQALYERMIGTLHLIQRGDEITRLEHFELEDRIHSTSKLHLSLSNEVYNNIAFELHIRKNNPLSLVYRKSANFHEEIWEKHIYEVGIGNDKIYDLILGPLFSPKQDVIFPTEWIWQEQEMPHDQELTDTDFMTDGIKVRNKYIHEVDWDIVVTCWHPIFKGLVATGEVHTEDISTFNDWNRDAIDFWPIFAQNELSILDINMEKRYTDERMILIQKLMQLDDCIRFIKGKTIYVTYDSKESITTDEIQMTSYVLRYREGV